MYQRSSMRYAHADGYTSVTYTPNGEFIITCGADGDIRKWTGIDDDDPSSQCLGEFVVCVAVHGARLFASTDLNTVQAYTLPEFDRDGTLLRFTAIVTCLRVNDFFIIAGSEDTTIKVLRQGDNEKEKELLGHEGPVLALDISCKDLLASISGDGTLKVWNLTEMHEVKTITGLPKIKSFEGAEYYGSPSFEPTQGKSLAYVHGKQVYVLNTVTWEVQFTLLDERIKHEYTCCQFSADGLFLAAASSAGELSVYDFVRKQPALCETSSECTQAITSLCWNPKNSDELSYCDKTGQLGTLFTDGTTPADLVDEVASECDKMEFGAGNDYLNDMADVDENDTGDDDGVSLERLKNDTMRAYNIDTDKNHSDTEDNDKPSRRSSMASEVRTVSLANKQQAAFQPSSTPKDLENRYLVWNNIGIVKAHQDPSGDGSIDVEFHDAAVHHSLHIANLNNVHTMASLSSTVLALSGDGATKISCIALEVAGNKEWSMELPDCEGVLAIVATKKLVAVATDMRFLRLFSVLGTQREIISIPGPVLAMAGFHDRLIVCYHSAPAYENQHISALLLQSIGMTLRSREIRVPLPAGRKMTWLGYSDFGSPVFADSMGLLQMYNMKNNLWYPICDTTKQSQSVSNNFFIIDVSERNQIVQAVLCRACTYPMTTPRPIVTELPLQLPLCDIELEKSQLEDVLTRSCNFDVTDAERAIKETAIKLFAVACRSDAEMRAHELIEMIASPTLLTLAVKYATKLGRQHLSDRLQELMPQLEEQQHEREKEERDMAADALSIIENSPLNAGLLLLKAKTQENTPASKLAPKPMVVGSGRRNPFKRLSATPNAPNLRAEFELNLDTQSTTTSSTLNTSLADSSISTPTTQQSPKPEKGFMPWFAKNKEQLQSKHPNASTAELAKIAMREFKQSKSAPTENLANPFAAKRKISELDDASPKQAAKITSAAEKLARFEYKK